MIGRSSGITICPKCHARIKTATLKKHIISVHIGKLSHPDRYATILKSSRRAWLKGRVLRRKSVKAKKSTGDIWEKGGRLPGPGFSRQ